MIKRYGTNCGRFARLAGLFATLAAPDAFPAPAVLHAPPALVEGPIPVTENSRPYLATAEDLASKGYVEEEFLISGRASVYDWNSDNKGVHPVTEPTPYVDRILVRRPADRKSFSGNIEVEPLNASTTLDLANLWPKSSGYIMRSGDVYVAFTSKPLTVKALQQFNPTRYASLNWKNPRAPQETCVDPTSIPVYEMGGEQVRQALPRFSSPETEDGLLWDIMAQLGALLKGPERNRILPGFAAPKLFANGISQSGILLRTWINGFHNTLRLADGSAIYDGYIVEAGPTMYRINQCAVPDIALDDPRNRIVPGDAAVVNLISEGDMWLAAHTRQPDAVKSRSGVVTYEVAGSPHPGGSRPDTPLSSKDSASWAATWQALQARSTQVQSVPPSAQPHLAPGAVQSNFPRYMLSTALLRDLQEWVRKGTPPPAGAFLALDDQLRVKRDALGNAIGGLRSPMIDVPIATYRGANGESGLATMSGSTTYFTPEQLHALYPTPSDYLNRLDMSVDQFVKARLILLDDAATLKADARKVSIP